MDKTYYLGIRVYKDSNWIWIPSKGYFGIMWRKLGKQRYALDIFKVSILFEIYS